MQSNIILQCTVMFLKEEIECLTFENEKKVHLMRKKESETYKVIYRYLSLFICLFLDTSTSLLHIHKYMMYKLTIDISMDSRL
jgi:hypothetical protein